jgi:hypothetical protein
MSRGGALRLAKWLHGIAVRLRFAMAEALGLKAGGEGAIHLTGARPCEVRKAPEGREMLARLRK